VASARVRRPFRAGGIDRIEGTDRIDRIEGCEGR